MIFDDIELLWVRIFGEFCGISQIWEATTAKQMKVNPYCERQRCYVLSVLFHNHVPSVDLSSLEAFIHALLLHAYLSVSLAFLFCIRNNLNNHLQKYSHN